MSAPLTATWFPKTSGSPHHQRHPLGIGTLVRDLDGEILLFSSTLPKAIEWAQAFDLVVHEEDHDLPITVDSDTISQAWPTPAPPFGSQPAMRAPAAHLGNVEAREGQDRCACGCKYWEHDRCIDCGTHVREAERLSD